MRTKVARSAGLKRLVAADGVFEAIVAVFDNVDRVKDRIRPGAFVGSLERWKASGDPIPVIWSHRWEDPNSHVGYLLDAAEVAGGLWVKAQVDVDLPFAGQVFHLLEARRVREFSFGYDVITERRAADGVNDLVELDLIEVGPTLKGVNPATSLLATKGPSSALAIPVTPRAVARYVAAVEADWARSGRAALSPAAALADISRLERC